MKRRQVAEINIVPYVDVMLVLLVIFMATAPLIMHGVQVDLPQLSAKKIDEQKNVPIVVTIDQDDNLFLNITNKPLESISEQQLQAEVAASMTRDPARLVSIKADHRVKYDLVLRTMVSLQQAGVASVGLETSDVVKS